MFELVYAVLVNVIFVVIFTHSAAACDLEEYRLPKRNPGWHVGCLRIANIINDTEFINCKFLVDGVTDYEYIFRKQVGDAGNVDAMYARFAEFAGSYSLTTETWKGFDVQGGHLRSIDRILQEEIVFIVTSGNWMWPAFRLGYQHENEMGLRIITLSLTPPAFYIPDFATLTECQYLFGLVTDLPSTQTSHPEVPQYRNDYTFALSAEFPQCKDDKIIKDIDDRAFRLGAPGHESIMEAFLVSKLNSSVQWSRVQDTASADKRLSTILVLLNDADSGVGANGGELLVGRNLDSNEWSRHCNIPGSAHADIALVGEYKSAQSCGYRDNETVEYLFAVDGDFENGKTFTAVVRPGEVCVAPKMGDAILIYNLHGDNTVREDSSYTLCPIEDNFIQWIGRKFYCRAFYSKYEDPKSKLDPTECSGSSALVHYGMLNTLSLRFDEGNRHYLIPPSH